MIHSTLSDGLCLLRLDAPPVNALTFALLDELCAALRQAQADPAVRAVVITGRADHFSAGADLGIFQAIASADDARRASRVFQEAFQEIEDSPKPVAAALAGHVLGGALELALACHYRVAAAESRFSMPEVRLGINPGAGGTQRLPRLIGPGAALELLLGGPAIDARQALALGLIDAVCPADDLVAHAGQLLASDEPLVCTGQRVDKIQDAAGNRAALEAAERTIAASRPEILAPRMIRDLVKIALDLPLTTGLRAEQEAFCACMGSRAAQNKIYVFCAGRQTAKIPGLDGPVTAPVTKAGVLGMGTMGAGIAQSLLAAGIAVTACDQDPAALRAAVEKIHAALENRVRQGKLTAERAERMAGLLTPSGDDGQLAAAELVVEAVFEDVDVKRAAIARLEEVCRPETLIATNTSTINLDLLAAGMRHPERLVGMHYFNPAQHMPLVEVVRREATPRQTVAAAVQVVKAQGKTPVLVRNREGFVVNRLFVPYLKEAFQLLEEGAEPAAVDRAMVEFGFAMGPLTLIDMAGLEILVLTEAILRRAFPDHGALSAIALRLVEAGHLGQKTGSGVYRYEPGDRTPHASHDAAAIIAAVRRQQGRPAGRTSDQDLAGRLVLRMVAEAFRVLEEQLVVRAADLDVAMVLGTGLADFRGGIVRYACDLGLDCVRHELRALAAKHGPRFAPCRLLEEAADEGRLLEIADHPAAAT